VRDTIEPRMSEAPIVRDDAPTLQMPAVDPTVRTVDERTTPTGRIQIVEEPGLPGHLVERHVPAAGWYIDPLDADRRRWWDGAAWTSYTRMAIPVEEAAEAARAQRAWEAGFVDWESLQQTPASRRDVRAERRERREQRDLARTLRDQWDAITEAKGPKVAEPGPRRGVRVETASIPWWELPERNPIATEAFVIALVSLLVNPGAVIGILAVILGGVGLTRSARTYHAAGRRRSLWAIGLGAVSALVWGAITVQFILSPEAFGFLMN